MGRFVTNVTELGAALLGGAALTLSGAYYYVHHCETAQRPPLRHVEVTYSFEVEDIPADAEKVRIWVPKPPSSCHQHLHGVTVSPKRAYTLAAEPEYSNEFMLFNIDGADIAGSADLQFSVVFDVTRNAIGPCHRHREDADYTGGELSRYLQPDRLVPVDGKIAREARAAIGDVKEPLKQIRRVYDRIVATVSYDKSGTGWGRGDALYACDTRRGNCTDFHSLFIGEARSLDIPARFIMGLPLPAGKTEGEIPGYHCWGEFHLSGKGWFPVDASEASKFPEKKDDYFARLDPNRVAFSVGRDITVPGSKSPPLNYAIYPHVEIDGQVHESVKTKFYFEDIPVTAAAP